jgi:hypothetical protein
MARIHLLSQAVARLIVTPRGDPEKKIGAVTCYIGLGDQFDDDRRRVRASIDTPGIDRQAFHDAGHCR